MENEKYYRCPKCNSLTTGSEIKDDIRYSGGLGMCMCRFMFPDENGDIVCTREYVEYEQITKKDYDRLKQLETNLEGGELEKCPKKKKLK